LRLHGALTAPAPLIIAVQPARKASLHRKDIPSPEANNDCTVHFLSWLDITEPLTSTLRKRVIHTPYELALNRSLEARRSSAAVSRSSAVKSTSRPVSISNSTVERSSGRSISAVGHEWNAGFRRSPLQEIHYSSSCLLGLPCNGLERAVEALPHWGLLDV
jgi:hypothetical protein